MLYHIRCFIIKYKGTVKELVKEPYNYNQIFQNVLNEYMDKNKFTEEQKKIFAMTKPYTHGVHGTAKEQIYSSLWTILARNYKNEERQNYFEFSGDIFNQIKTDISYSDAFAYFKNGILCLTKLANKNLGLEKLGFKGLISEKLNNGIFSGEFKKEFDEAQPHLNLTLIKEKEFKITENDLDKKYPVDLTVLCLAGFVGQNKDWLLNTFIANGKKDLQGFSSELKEFEPTAKLLGAEDPDNGPNATIVGSRHCGKNGEYPEYSKIFSILKNNWGYKGCEKLEANGGFELAADFLNTLDKRNMYDNLLLHFSFGIIKTADMLKKQHSGQFTGDLISANLKKKFFDNKFDRFKNATEKTSTVGSFKDGLDLIFSSFRFFQNTSSDNPMAENQNNTCNTAEQFVNYTKHKFLGL